MFGPAVAFEQETCQILSKIFKNKNLVKFKKTDNRSLKKKAYRWRVDIQSHPQRMKLYGPT